MAEVRLLILTIVIFFNFLLVFSAKDNSPEGAKKPLKKKDIRDYTDAEVERIYDQWEEADEPLEDDELPEWKRPQPKIDLSKINPADPEGMLKMTKQGRTLMMFASVSGNPTEKETEQITQLWQSMLFNAHYDIQRYVVGTDRVLFMLNDGSKAWEIKDFLVKQDRCKVVTIEGKDYPGKGSDEKPSKDGKEKKKKSKESSKKSTSKASSSENEIHKSDGREDL